MSDRKLLFSVTLDDCRVDTFRAGGKGGQHQNKTESGVRIVHPPSGAVGESREERSQLQNKKKAWKRMVESAKFKIWISQQLLDESKIESEVERLMDSKFLRVEGKKDGKWTPLDDTQ